MKKILLSLILLYGVIFSTTINAEDISYNVSPGRYWKGEYVEYSCPSTSDMYTINFIGGKLEYGCGAYENEYIASTFYSSMSDYRAMVYQGSTCGTGYGSFDYGYYEGNGTPSVALTNYERSLPCKDHGAQVRTTLDNETSYYEGDKLNNVELITDYTIKNNEDFNEVTNQKVIDSYIKNYMDGKQLECKKTNIPDGYKKIIYDENGLPILVYDVVLSNGDIGQYYLPGTQIGKARAEKQENYYMYEVCLQDDGTIHYFDDVNEGNSYDASHLPQLNEQQILSNKETSENFEMQYK